MPLLLSNLPWSQIALYGSFSLAQSNASYIVYPPMDLLGAALSNGRAFHVEH